MSQKAVKNIEAIYALTPMQEGMLFHARLHPESSLYFAQVRCDLEGPLAVERFRRAFQSAVDRHPALRTCFVWRGLDEPRQVVRRQVELPFEPLDWRDRSAERFTSDLAAWLEEDRVRGFALDRAPLMRLTLFHRGDESWHLVWSNHHLVIDGWSIPRVMGDVLIAYQRGESALPPAPRPFQDYVAWLGRQDLGAAEAFWRRTLHGITAPTPLGLGRGAPPRDGGREVGSAHGEWLVDLEPGEVAALERVAAQERLTLNTLVQGAWALLLARYNGNADVVFGTTVAGRPPELRGVEGMVGLFINSLPARVVVESGAARADWLRALQDQQLEARRFEHAPLVRVQEWSAVPRGVPLFESLLIFESYPVATGSDAPGELRMVNTESSVFSNYPLALLAVPSPGGLRFHLKFDRAHLDDEHAEQIVDQLRHVLGQLAADPRARVDSLELIASPHADRLPDPAATLPLEDPPSPSERLAFWARETPDAPALEVTTGEGCRGLSYRELDRRVEALAAALEHEGLLPGDVVAIASGRTAGLVVAMAAVLRAGGALLNLDGALPAARRHLMVERAGARCAIWAESNPRGELPLELGALPVLRVDDEGRLAAQEDRPNRDRVVRKLDPDGPAYVFFTSGTTGEPKPVLGRRRGLAHFLAWQSARFAIAPGDRGAQLTGPAFDVVLRDVFLALVSGATLCLPLSLLDALRPDRLLPWLAASRITFLHVVPSVARAWLGGGVEATLPELRWLFFAGEPLADTVIRSMRDRFAPHAAVANLYGPTETTLAKCCGVLAPDTSPEAGIQNVGRPLPGAQALILRRDLATPTLAGLGEVGEIVLRTPYRSLGYLGSDPLGGRFFVNPWRDDADDLLYRTGDLGRLLPDGRLAILGRLDDQVKVRGTRVEPAEVAAVLGDHPGVAAVFVAGRRDERGETELVAWLEPKGQVERKTAGFEREGVAELRRWLGERLPAAYVPSRFVVVRPMPLNANGKVDRAALPAPVATPAGGERAPRTATEELMVDLWAQVLARPVGVEDHFFDLGGHSLLATQLLSRVRATFGVELPLRAIFDHPTVRGLAAAADLVLSASEGLASLPPPRPVPRDPAGQVLSSAQRRLWFLQQLDPQGVAYNLPTALRLVGALDRAALVGTFERLVARHESLRTRFVPPVDDDEPRQLVLEAAPVAFAFEDLADLGADARAVALAERLQQEARTAFDLARGPLLRLRLLRLATTEHVLVVTLHHIVSDGWSVGVLVREVAALYAALAAGEEPQLAPLPIQYADFAVWQREHLEGERLAGQLRWWRERLDGVPPVLELPTDRPRPPVASGRGLRVHAVVAKDVAAKVRALARDHAATPYMVLLGVYATLLARYSGQDAFAIGSPVANRGSEEVEGLIGFFVNTLVMPVAPRRSRTFIDLLVEIKDTTLGAYAHQDVPFDRLVEELAPERRLDRTPLFQVMLVLQNAPLGELRLPGLALELLDARTGGTKFDLDLILRDAGEHGLAATLELAADLYEADTGERLLGHFAALLADIVADPRRPLAAFDLLPAAERRALEAAAGPPALVPEPVPLAAGPGFRGLFERFVEQVGRTPQALCLVDDDEELDFTATRAQAERLAGWLRGHGIGIEDRVALLVERSAAAVVGMLGILAAGAAYVPIDPRYPSDRRRWMFADAGLRAAVTRRSHAADLAGELPAGCVVLALEDLPAAPAMPLSTPATEPEQAAYVIYTSGSTGRPKGVVVEHGHLMAYLLASEGRLGFEPGMVYALVQPLGFDSAVTAVHPPLVFGGTVLLVGEDAALDPTLLAERFAELRPDCLKISPSHLGALLAEPAGPARLAGCRPRDVLPTRLLVVGGEALRCELAARVLELAPDLAVHNEYGPTETTVGIVTRRADLATVSTGAATVPIGRALPGATARVLDSELRPMPFGVPGELYLGGPAVTRGYLGQPAATAARFVPDPFVDSFVGLGRAPGGGRLYRTGDRARLWPDGELEFLGRVDHQVKIRGHRVEIGEIEATLDAHPAVAEAAVLARGQGSRDAQAEARAEATLAEAETILVGYVVPRAGVPIDEPTLRRDLEAKLPEYLVPSRFVLLDALPRNRHGKLDRDALPSPVALARPGGAGVAPRTPTEELLAELWCRLLGVERVEPEDDFFALGGHSLLATRLATRVRAALEVELPVRTIFEAPRLAALAARIEALRSGPRRSLPPPPRRRATSGQDAGQDAGQDPSQAPLSFAQERLWFLDRLEPGSPAYNVGGAVALHGELDPAVLESALVAIVRRHEVLRTAFRDRDGRPFQTVDPEIRLDFALLDLAAQLGEAGAGETELRAATRSVLRQQALEPFDLAAGHLFRVRLLRLEPRRHVLAFTLHHIVSDAWSHGVVVRELTELYRALASGRPAESTELADLPIQYADYAVWQREWLGEGEALAEQLDYWRRALAGLAESLDLPTDRPRPPMLSARGASVALPLPAELGARIRRLGSELGATPFMTLLAAFQSLLSRWSGQRDIAVGTPVAGRGHADLEPLVGFFINTLVVRTIVDPAEPFAGLVRRVRESVLDAFAHQDLPFERLVDALQPARSLDHTPLFQVLFVLQNVERQTLELPGLEVLPALEEDLGATTKFDLTLFVEELPPAQGSGPGTFALRLQYSTDLFDEATMVRFLSHYRGLLEAATGDSERATGRLELMGEAERALVWPRAEPLPAPAATTLHQWVQLQAARTPDAVALDAVAEAGGRRRTWTYAELIAESGGWAHGLRSLGVGGERPVAVCLERHGTLPIALLAVLQAGGAYVPLDPTYPPERLRQTLEDSGATVVITAHSLWVEGALAELAASLEGSIRTLFVDRVPTLDFPASPPDVAIDPEQIAYFIYTSGSTGRPKGVAIAHRNAVAMVAWAASIDSAAWLGSVLASTSICFDLSVYELFVPLCLGGTVVLVDNALGLAGLDPETGITLVNTVPSAMSELLRQGAVPPSVRAINLAGEPLQGRLVDGLYALAGVDAVYNLYGPSEDTTYSTFVRVPRERTGEPTIGRPVAGTSAAVVDREGQLVPVGIPGDLLLGGAGVSRGYFGRPALTAERFMPDPWSERPGARLYRTGDLVRWLPSGELAFLGRLDHQVKIRGFRVELGEIEDRLRRLEGIAEAVVVALGEQDGVRLAAYVVPADPSSSADLAAAELAEFAEQCATGLRRHLPEHMVPAFFVRLDALPLTPNGKVDRKALPRTMLGVGAGARGDRSVAPRTPTEALVAEIWREVLGLESLSVHDDFFALGGHSLSATRVVAQLRRAFGRCEADLPVRLLFEAATVAALAARLESGTAGAPETVDLWADAELPPEIQPEIQQEIRPGDGAGDRERPWRHVLVTGATGFVGAHLLARLLERTEARVLCLVRAANRAAAFERLRRTLSERGLWREAWSERIEPLVGDLAEPRLGLAAADWARARRECDVIFHAGSWVNVAYPYSVLRATNVLGTREILRLAAEGRIPLHVLSTLSVFFDRAADRPGTRIAEDDPLAHAAGPASGYARSKWVAEKLVQEARRRGSPVTVHRFGRVGWHRETGDWNTEDVLFHVLTGCLLLGRAPAVDLPVDVVAVDELVEAIVTLAGSAAPDAACHYLPARVERWPRLVEWLGRLGLDVEAVPFDEWVEELQRRAPSGDALMKLVALTAGAASGPSSDEPVRPQAGDEAARPQAGDEEDPRRFADDRTAAAMHRVGLTFSALDLDLFRPVVEWLGQRLGLVATGAEAPGAAGEDR